MRDIQEQLQAILTFGQGETFLSFANADGKRWLMPERGMHTAMLLYQPSGWKGKGVKRVLPALYWHPWVRRLLHAERMRLSLSEELRRLLEHTFGESGLEFAVFCGTPCVHQKITIQVYRGDRILGYVKVTDSEDIARVFAHEETVLQQLHERGVDGIPECRYCGTLTNGLWAFVQTTRKTMRSKVLHGWTGRHTLFLEDLHEKTLWEGDFGETDFYRDLRRLEARLPELADGKYLEAVIRDVMATYVGGRVQFSAFHADFTPWNMFLEEGKLFVFDWEYARMTYPPRLDAFHYRVQTAVFEEHLAATDLMARYRREREELKNRWVHPDFSFRCYLLAVMSLYVAREEGELCEETRERVAFWVKLLQELEK